MLPASRATRGVVDRAELRRRYAALHRLRVVLTPAELAALPPRVLFTNATHAALTAWVKKHYREKLAAADLADPLLLDENRRTLDELSRLLGLGSIYPFQTAGLRQDDDAMECRAAFRLKQAAWRKQQPYTYWFPCVQS